MSAHWDTALATPIPRQSTNPGYGFILEGDDFRCRNVGALLRKS